MSSILALAACGDDNDAKTDATDTTPDVTPDVAPDTTPDVAPDIAPDVAPDTTAEDTSTDTTPDTGPVVTCDRTGFTSVAEDAGFTFGILNYLAQSTLGAPVDVLNIQFITDNGGASAPGNFTFTGENYATCGNCLTIFVGCDANLANCAKTFLADSGTMVLDSIGDSEDQLKGSLTDVVLVEVTVDNAFVSSVVEGGETWCLPSQTFDLTIQ
jgi:hypothetical protein